MQWSLVLTTEVVVVVTLGLVSLGRSKFTARCFNVSTSSTTLTDLERAGRLFSQVASVNTIGVGLDSVCSLYCPTRTPNNTLVQLVFNYNNGEESDRYALIQTMLEPGLFPAAGPARSYTDRILGTPCRGCFVIYRCSKPDGETDPSKVDVFVTCTRRLASQNCIEEGKRIAQESFPGLLFYDLSKKNPNPCSTYQPLNIFF